MWPDRRLTELFEIEHPLVLAPMAGLGTVGLAAFSMRGRRIRLYRLRDNATTARREDNSGVAGADEQTNQRQLLLP